VKARDRGIPHLKSMTPLVGLALATLAAALARFGLWLALAGRKVLEARESRPGAVRAYRQARG